MQQLNAKQFKFHPNKNPAHWLGLIHLSDG